MAHLEAYLQDIMDQGGEGIILRDPSAPFVAGRCPGYLKHKVSPLPFKTKFIIGCLHFCRNSVTLKLKWLAMLDRIPGNANCKPIPSFLRHPIYSLTNRNYLWRPNGVRFTAAAGTSEFTKRWNPSPGDIVSFKHHGFLLLSKKPKFPTLYRIRQDLSWEDVVQNWKTQKTRPTGIVVVVVQDVNSELIAIIFY